MTLEEEVTKTANELIDSFKALVYPYMGSGMLSNDYDDRVILSNAKKCALIVVKNQLQEHSCYTLNSERWHFWSAVEEKINSIKE